MKKVILNQTKKLPIAFFLLLALGPIMNEAAGQAPSISLEKGQVLTLITAAMKPGQDDARSRYFEAVFPIAEEHGFKLEGSLSLTNVQSENYAPFPIMNLFSWPNAEAERAFQAHPEWPAFNALRPAIWDELRMTSLVLENNVTLDFKADKLYRVAFLWINPEHPQNFDTYRQGIKNTAEQLGARYLFITKGQRFYSLMHPARGTPDYVWIIEWPNKAARNQYLESEAFKQYYPFFQSGVTYFDAYEATIVNETTN